MNILIDENVPHAQAFFTHLGSVIRAPGRSICRADLTGIDALIVRSVTQVNQTLLEGSSVRFVGTCTIGTDHLDLPYLAQQGIAWASAQGCNANSVVEYVFAAMAYCRPQWREQTIGIIGCGNVGGRLYRRLQQLAVKVRVYDPLLPEDSLPDLTELHEVLAADIICVHTPLTQTGPYPTLGMIGCDELNQLKPSALLLNAGRGEVLDGPALLQHIQQQPELSVVLDVWPNEPDISLELMAAVDIATPHIAGYSYDGKATGTAMIYQALCKYLGDEPKVNLSDVLQQVAQPQLGWPSDQDDLHTFLRQAYDIQADDTRTRHALITAAKQANSDSRASVTTVTTVSAAFDHLRKTYPTRREWHNYLAPANLTTDQQALLHALGFTV